MTLLVLLAAAAPAGIVAAGALLAFAASARRGLSAVSLRVEIVHRVRALRVCGALELGRAAKSIRRPLLSFRFAPHFFGRHELDVEELDERVVVDLADHGAEELVAFALVLDLRIA